MQFFNHPVARKDLKFERTKLPFALLTDRCANRLKAFDLHREDYSNKPAAEHIYLERENKQIIPSLTDFTTDRFYTVILFTKQFTAVLILHSKLDLKACLQNKGVVRRLFGSILISYTSEMS